MTIPFLHNLRFRNSKCKIPNARCNLCFVINRTFVTGNMTLKDLSANTLRKLGLCEDHFLPTAFTSTTKERLRRDAVPIAHEDSGASTSNENEVGEIQNNDAIAHSFIINQNVSIAHENIGLLVNDENEMGERQRNYAIAHSSIMNENVSITHENIGSLLYDKNETNEIQINDTIAHSPIMNENADSLVHDENQMGEIRKNDAILHSPSNENMKDQISAQRTLRTYRPAILNFAVSAEEEDTMEWVHLEPPIDKDYNYIERKDKEKTNSNAKIKALRIENSKLRQKIKHLKFRMQRMAQMCKCKHSNKKKTNKKIKAKQEIKTKKEILRSLINEQELHPVAKTMINLQLHIPRTRYSEEEKMLSKQLYYYSASAFCRLKKAGCNFPGQRTIRRWIEEFSIKPGFCDIIFQNLQKKIAQIPEEERVCALKWDEMSIKSYEEYSLTLDEVEGLVDLGPLGRQTERAKCVFVFCLDSLNACHPWRQPLAYFLPGKCMKSHEIVSLVQMCLDKLSETGANVKLITCDQGTSNQAAYNQLGIDVQKPYFTYNNKKYYALYDFPHLVKRLASFLRTHNNIYYNGDIIASYSDFIETWRIDNATTGGSNLLSHITQAHIYPNCFEAMNVKRAFQLFSNKFAAAIKTAGDEEEINSNTWRATADFAKHMNNVIDACNSYSLNIKFGGKRPLSRKNPDIEDLLSNFVQWCSGWSKLPNKISQVPCFKGFVITIQTIVALYKELASTNEEFELATGLCNQDSVEHFFSKLRQRGGFNPNPTARMVRLSMRHILSTGYIQTSNKGNVQCPESEALINKPNQIIKTVENCMNKNNFAAIDDTDYDIDDDDAIIVTDLLDKYADILEEYDVDMGNISISSNYNENAITYFAGYVARRCFEKNDCNNCRAVMLKTPMEQATSNERYIEYREYPNADEDAPTVTKLVRPTRLFTDVIKTQLMSFNRTWQHHWASTQVLEKITNEAMHATKKMHAGWFNTNNICYTHRMQAAKFLMMVKIHSRTRYNNHAAKTVNTFKRKIKNLSNK